MKWEILICSVLERTDLINRLLDSLHAQIDDERVGIIVYADNKQMTIAEKRNRLLSMATAEYVCFIDDDDLVDDNYVKTIYRLLDGADYVGFMLQHYYDGKPSKPTHHSVKYKGWSEDGYGFYRDISHLNPIKREIAQKFTFRNGIGEDEDWSSKVAKSGLVQSEHFIPRPMYYYYYDSKRSLSNV